MGRSDQLTCGEIAAGVGQGLSIVEHGVRLNLVSGARVQVVRLILERIVLDRNSSVRL